MNMRSLSRSFHPITRRVCAAMLAFACCPGEASAQPQQPFSVPTSIGPAISPQGLQLLTPLQAVGTMVLARRNTVGFGEELGVYPRNSASHAIFTVHASNSALVFDPFLERGVNIPTRVFYTDRRNAQGDRHLLSAVALSAGPASIVRTLPPGSGWRLRAVSLTNTRFILQNINNGQVIRFDIGAANDVALGAFPITTSFALSPDGSKLAVGSGGGAIVVSLVGGPPLFGGMTTPFTIQDGPFWIDNRFIVVKGLQNGARILRIDTQVANADAFLTTPGNVSFGDPMSISDNHEWLSFVVERSFGTQTERVPAVMRVADAATAPVGPNGPGGAYVPLGDYRSNTQVTSYTNWLQIGRTVICAPATPAGGPVSVIWMGRKTPGAAIEVFRSDVLGEITASARGQGGTTVSLQAVVPPFTNFGVILADVNPRPQPDLIPTLFDNHLLLDQPFIVGTVTGSGGAPVSLPVQLPVVTSPNRFIFQMAWFSVAAGTLPALSAASELPVF